MTTSAAAAPTSGRVKPKPDPRYHLSRRDYDRLMRETPRGPRSE